MQEASRTGRLRRGRWWLGRRLVPFWFNLRRSLGLIGWSREHGPPTRPGTTSRSVREGRSAVPVVVCVWRRPHLLPRTIESLAAQSHGPIRLVLWNNNPRLRDVIESCVSAGEIEVDVVHSARNVGGFGRFYGARDLVGSHAFVVFLDDDQAPPPDFVGTLVEEFQPGTIRSRWAYRFRGIDSYWDRVPAEPGQRVKYCGTGGMICDAGIFHDPALYTCPRRFWFVEDLWLSFYADSVRGWPLYKSAAELVREPDEHAQYGMLGSTKDRLYRHLVRRGWDPLLTTGG